MKSGLTGPRASLSRQSMLSIPGALVPWAHPPGKIGIFQLNCELSFPALFSHLGPDSL